MNQAQIEDITTCRFHLEAAKMGDAVRAYFQHCCLETWVITSGINWTLLIEDAISTENGDIPASYVSLLEGNHHFC